MTLQTSVWNPYRSTLPTQFTALQWDQLRKNLFAQAAAVAAGVAPTWNYTNSKTRNEASPGTAAAPARKYWWRGTGNTKQWVKAVLTWTGTDITKIALYYSEDNETSYVPMLDEGDTNYVLTLVYDGSHNLQSTYWSNAP